MIKEIIIVEGRDDEAAVKRAVEAETIATHGFGIRRETLALIEKAYAERGIIIFTDPDFAGEKIRKRLSERFPGGKHAFLPREEAYRDGDVGIENAAPESIREALGRARAVVYESRAEFRQEDLLTYGLAGSDGAAARRDKLGKVLGIGYGNGKAFLNRLNQYGIERQEFAKAIKEMDKIE
ncbi:MAG TPA: ribonuclease M5 [Anaerovoracaceae bacterium]|nr:ribonuclease M5 [Anaerovoracaceae bacterium]